MPFPVRVTWKHHDPSTAVEDYIREQAARLERVAQDIIDCSVTVETPHQHQEHGNHFLVTVDVIVPGHELVAKRDPASADNHTEVHAAIKDAFESMKHQLQHYYGKRRDKTRQPRA
jgi:ribosomal subunit interface protein